MRCDARIEKSQMMFCYNYVLLTATLNLSIALILASYISFLWSLSLSYKQYGCDALKTAKKYW
jgi:hypothetical protein